MVRRIAIIETVWRLALQDGWADNEEYQTEAEAKAALKKLGPHFRRGTMIRSVTREVKP